MEFIKNNFFDIILAMYSIEKIAEHLKEKHALPVQENQFQDLRNIGYFHGYKGYRFIRKSNNPIKFTAFSQIVDLNNFDMQLKGLLYPNLMFIENALKSYVLEATLEECQKEKLNDVYKLALTRYKDDFTHGSNNYKKEFKKRMDLEIKINSSIIRDYVQGKDFINHYYNQDRDVPIWAAFESLTLGEFGNFYSCANKAIRDKVSNQLNLPKNFNDDGFLLEEIIFTLKDLRNAIAHNGIIFDTRFATKKVPERICKMLEQELQTKSLDFNYIVSYIALLVFMLNKMGESKKCKSMINEFLKLHEILRKLPVECLLPIKGTFFEHTIKAMGIVLNCEFKL